MQTTSYLEISSSIFSGSSSLQPETRTPWNGSAAFGTVSVGIGGGLFGPFGGGSGTRSRSSCTPMTRSEVGWRTHAPSNNSKTAALRARAPSISVTPLAQRLRQERARLSGGDDPELMRGARRADVQKV